MDSIATDEDGHSSNPETNGEYVEDDEPRLDRKRRHMNGALLRILFKGVASTYSA